MVNFKCGPSRPTHPGSPGGATATCRTARSLCRLAAARNKLEPAEPPSPPPPRGPSRPPGLPAPRSGLCSRGLPGFLLNRLFSGKTVSPSRVRGRAAALRSRWPRLGSGAGALGAICSGGRGLGFHSLPFR